MPPSSAYLRLLPPCVSKLSSRSKAISVFSIIPGWERTTNKAASARTCHRFIASGIGRRKMAWGRISGNWESPKIDLMVDMGNPFLNRTVDGFLKIGIVGASKALADETYRCLNKGTVSRRTAEQTLEKMCREGAYWGTIAGLYVGMEYGIERIRGTRDWKNAMLGGAVAGALVSAASNKSNDNVIVDAITGAALATASDFINQIT